MALYNGSTMPILSLPPDYASYAVTDSAQVLAVKLKGGASRYRQDILNSTSTVDCQWTLTATQYEYWRAFYRTATNTGAYPFYCPLTLDRSGVSNFKCYFVPDSISVSGMDGDVVFVIQAQLEVYPNPPDPISDAAIIAFNSNLQTSEDRLNTIVNYNIPQMPF
jgi:hypothetical protein